MRVVMLCSATVVLSLLAACVPAGCDPGGPCIAVRVANDASDALTADCRGDDILLEPGQSKPLWGLDDASSQDFLICRDGAEVATLRVRATSFVADDAPSGLGGQATIALIDGSTNGLSSEIRDGDELIEVSLTAVSSD